MFANREGQRIPDVSFRTRRDNEWRDVTSREVFAGRTVVVFSLPGAFTPTCSSAHVPRFNELAPVFRRNGVDEIVCISVNDAFVMNEWARDQQAHHVTFMPDGNGEFTGTMGMLVDRHELGFGKRSWRYSMLVRDGVIEKMFIEPDVPGDPYEVSDADTMLAYIAPQATAPLNVTVFSREGCPHCVRTKGMLHDAGIAFEELVLNRDFSESTIRAISVQPDAPFHGLEGMKHMPTALVPGIYDPSLADENIEIQTETAHRAVKRLIREEGMLVGVSSGAAIAACIEVARSIPRERHAMIVTIFADNGEKYLSERFWEETPEAEADEAAAPSLAHLEDTP